MKGFKRILYTNCANTLSSCGRKIEAIAQYKKAINVSPSFGIALGNLGRVYQDYGIMDYDDRHQDYFHNFAYSLLKNTVECKAPTLMKKPKNVSLKQCLICLKSNRNMYMRGINITCLCNFGKKYTMQIKILI